MGLFWGGARWGNPLRLTSRTQSAKFNDLGGVLRRWWFCALRHTRQGSGAPRQSEENNSSPAANTSGRLGLGTKVMSLPVFSGGTQACSNSPLTAAQPTVALMSIFINRMLEEASQQKNSFTGASLFHFSSMRALLSTVDPQHTAEWSQLYHVNRLNKWQINSSAQTSERTNIYEAKIKYVFQGR